MPAARTAMQQQERNNMKRMIELSLGGLVLVAALCQAQPTPGAAAAMTLTKMDESKHKDWLARWDKNITREARNYCTCDREVGEGIAWGMTPIMDGFYYGYMATKDAKYVDLWVDWTDSLIKRAVKEPDGYLGWPGKDPNGTEVDHLDRLFGDSMLSDAMVFRSIVRMSGEVLKTPALKEKYGAKAESYLKLAEHLYNKWEKRGGWRETGDGGNISVVLYYGLDKNGNWSADPAERQDPNQAFSHPDNKANQVARWLLALWDVTGNTKYRDRAEKWFKVQKSRMTLESDGTYKIWNYWEPAGPWDNRADGRTTKHWLGVHPNGGYYEDDTQGIVDAYEHGLVFTKGDIDHLINTAKTSWAGGNPARPVAGMAFSVQPATGTAKVLNACFPNALTAEPASAGNGALSGKIVSVEWNAAAKTGKIVVQPKDPAAARVTIETDKGTKVQVLRMWSALAPYDTEIQKTFEAVEEPDGWGGLSGASYYLMLQSRLAGK
jgi:hypothetical protein